MCVCVFVCVCAARFSILLWGISINDPSIALSKRFATRFESARTFLLFSQLIIGHISWVSLKKNVAKLWQSNNKRHSHSPIFSVNGAQKILIEQATNHFEKETRYWQGNLDGDLVSKNQAGSSRKLWVLGLTKYECQIDPYAFSNHQYGNTWNTWKSIMVISGLHKRIQISSSREGKVGTSR